MRENVGLFRGKQLNNGEWVVGYYVRLSDSKCNVSHRIYPGYAETDCGDFYPDWYEVDPETVGECTVLKDKNGRLIFEGDICRTTRTGEIVSVKWHGTMAGYVWSKRTENSYIHDFGELFRACDKYEVIGNIHDNKELFES